MIRQIIHRYLMAKVWNGNLPFITEQLIMPNKSCIFFKMEQLLTQFL